MFFLHSGVCRKSYLGTKIAYALVQCLNQNRVHLYQQPQWAT